MTNFTRQKLYYIKLGIRRKLSSACREVTIREPLAAAARRAAAAASAAAAPLPMPRAAREAGGASALLVVAASSVATLAMVTDLDLEAEKLAANGPWRW